MQQEAWLGPLLLFPRRSCSCWPNIPGCARWPSSGLWSCERCSATSGIGDLLLQRWVLLGLLRLGSCPSAVITGVLGSVAEANLVFQVEKSVCLLKMGECEFLQNVYPFENRKKKFTSANLRLKNSFPLLHLVSVQGHLRGGRGVQLVPANPICHSLAELLKWIVWSCLATTPALKQFPGRIQGPPNNFCFSCPDHKGYEFLMGCVDPAVWILNISQNIC